MQLNTILRTIRPVITTTVIAIVLTGCNPGLSSSSQSSTAISGNWQFTSKDAFATALPQVSGALSGTAAAFTGTLHPTYANACITPQTLISVSGSVDTSGNLQMTSSPFGQGSILTLRASYANGSLTNAAYTVTGGSCAFASAKLLPTAAMQLQPISGAYQGSFTDASAQTIPVTATLTQSAQPDSNGIYHVAGNATFPGNPCLTSPAVTDSTITGNTLSTTYTQQQGSGVESVIASGTFDASAATLTVTGWTLSGPCGADTGTGTLTRQ